MLFSRGKCVHNAPPRKAYYRLKTENAGAGPASADIDPRKTNEPEKDFRLSLDRLAIP